MSEFQSIRTVKYSNLSHLDHKDQKAGKLPPGLENLCCEVFNSGAEEITFRSIHPDWKRMYFFGKSPLEWHSFKCKPGEWAFLPHGQYIWTVPSGSKEYRVVINVGDQMFQGNKYPSRPEVSKMRFFGGSGKAFGVK